MWLLLLAQDAAERGVVEDIGKTVKAVDEVGNPEFVWRMTVTLCVTAVLLAGLLLRKRK